MGAGDAGGGRGEAASERWGELAEGGGGGCGVRVCAGERQGAWVFQVSAHGFGMDGDRIGGAVGQDGEGVRGGAIFAGAGAEGGDGGSAVLVGTDSGHGGSD